MKTTQTLLIAVILGTGLLSATGAQAALQTRLGGLAVYDTDLNITWLSNANLAATNTFGLATGVNLGTDIYGFQSAIFSSGNMNWGGAMKWVAAMNVANYLGYHDWRLPTTTDTGAPGCDWSYNGGTDCGYNSTGSEMSHLFYTELGNKGYYNTAGEAQSGYGLVNTGPFTNFMSDRYWSGTEYAPSANHAWVFNTIYGNQNLSTKDNYRFALAVRPGQVAVVPVPAAGWLLGSGLLGLIGVTWRRLAL